MAGVFVPPGKQRFVDTVTGIAIAGGFVFMYIPGTDTPKDTWQDEALSILNANPVPLDADGQCTIWGTGLYRQVLQRVDLTTVWDQVTGFLDGGASVTFATPAQVAALAATDLVISPFALGASGVLGGGGSGGYGSHKPLSTFGALDLSGVTVGSNDTILAAAEADATSLRFYGPQGTIRTNLTKDQLTKGYIGDADFITGPGAGDGAFRPSNYAYMAVKPSTWPVQGDGGFWRGDNRFNDGGEWKIIGPNVRTYDIASRYFEQNTIPHPAWLDINSGGSGIDAFLTSGAAAGSSLITINGPATAAWIGQTVAFSLTSDGAVAESHTVSGIAGSSISIAPSVLANTYTWNPAGGQTPCIFFGHRTFAGMGYVKMRNAAAGDSYGDVVRQNNNYVPLASQYHSFMCATTGQYGGDVTFGSDGVYGQFFESQLQAGTFDVTAIGFVGSLVRNVDTALTGGKFWAATWFNSGGTRPADAGHVLLGAWRNGLDTVFATMEETGRLTVGATGGVTSTFTLATTNGAHPNDPFVIGGETLTIQSVNAGANTVTTTAACVGTYSIGQLVVYPRGGAVLNMAKGQKMVFNSSLAATQRGADPLTVFPALYGNVQGDMILEGGSDGSGDFISFRFARGTTAAIPDTARVRLRPTGLNVFGTGGHTFNGTSVSLTSTTSFNMDLTAGALATWGPGIFFRVSGGNLQLTTDGGSTYHNL